MTTTHALTHYLLRSERPGHTRMMSDGIAAALVRGEQVMVFIGKRPDEQYIKDSILQSLGPGADRLLDNVQFVSVSQTEILHATAGHKKPAAIDNHAWFVLFEQWRDDIEFRDRELHDLKNRIMVVAEERDQCRDDVAGLKREVERMSGELEGMTTAKNEALDLVSRCLDTVTALDNNAVDDPGFIEVEGALEALRKVGEKE